MHDVEEWRPCSKGPVPQKRTGKSKITGSNLVIVSAETQHESQLQCPCVDGHDVPTCSACSARLSAAAACALACFTTVRAWSSFCAFAAAFSRAVSASSCSLGSCACRKTNVVRMELRCYCHSRRACCACLRLQLGQLRLQEAPQLQLV